ncbi:hypothetical protein RhiirA5_422694 [Rhizophagus irregularis]|uniref:Ricin B lectin domain-containing protein n=1 Tax=Rhizophagus irregularis TaxID=588596 RepID=A0A2N0RSD1_9GLOM|nr:hypothetical protein RhiirA5_422694 [Rhizophagus irregularis]PKC66197.1 hypothetical protein RhiirA1_460040 [Rhizophagus irregularis]CAB4488728.1 unnamed protein product [Rhizophagus irregularis]CAB5217294.1 unnamed protein product [Rhizophagus irregularis]CAB5384069.1 unnamed protein product [Rhizophagus irregularis]
MKVRNSEFLNCLGFLLLFIISTYCSLIPNDWVNTDDPKDFGLLEGITYNIVHFVSEKNLVSVGDHVQVGVSDDNNSYQHWSLRKVEGKNNHVYNIINIGSGTNLDNNGKGVYVSSLEHDSNTNPYQHWIFMKIKNNTYNIANVRNESRSLDGSIDSNGKLVYISISNKNNSYQQWLFKPTNYKLITKVVDFNLDVNYGQMLTSNATLLRGNNRIENPTNAIIEQIIDRTEEKSNVFTLQIRKADSFEVGKHVDMTFEIGINIFNLINVKVGNNIGIEGKFSSTEGETNSETVLDTVSYHIQQKVIVPFHTSVIVTTIVDKVNILTPFTARIRITGKADRLSKSGTVVKMANIDNNAILYYLQRENAKDLFLDKDFYYIKTNGTLGIDGYGFGSVIKTKSISGSTRKKPIILYQILFIILQFIYVVSTY